MSIQKDSATEIVNSPEFKMLVQRRMTFSLTLTVLMLTVYFGFILIIAFNKELLAMKVGTHLTLGIPAGIGIILFAWLLTGVYTRWANKKYDSAVRELRNRLLQK